jgi:hypothetical protein
VFLEFGQTGMREINVGEAIVSLAPGVSGTRNIAKHRRRHGFAMSGGQQRQHSRLLPVEACKPARSVGRDQHSAGT